MGGFGCNVTPDKTPVGEAIRILTEDLLGLDMPTPPPSWAVGRKFPGEDAIERELVDLNREKGLAIDRIKDASRRLEQRQRFKRLLFADGHELEEVVWDALTRFDVQVHDPTEVGKEDRWVSLPWSSDVLVLEIKGHTGSMVTKDARQADDWVSRFLEVRGPPVKGVLIGNPYRTDDPSARRPAWPDDIMRYAKTRHLALLTTVQLYDALVLFEEGNLDVKGLFAKILISDGPVP